MYNNVTLYYLNQIGIRPWIKRSNITSCDKLEGTVCQGRVKLVVFTSLDLSFKAKSLLQCIMSYINLDEDELTLIPIKEESLQSTYNTTIQQYSPLAILMFGFSQYKPVTHEDAHALCLNNIDLEVLIANPIEKRTVFKLLTELKHLIASKSV